MNINDLIYCNNLKSLCEQYDYSKRQAISLSEMFPRSEFEISSCEDLYGNRISRKDLVVLVPGWEDYVDEYPPSLENPFFPSDYNDRESSLNTGNCRVVQAISSHEIHYIRFLDYLLGQYNVIGFVESIIKKPHPYFHEDSNLDQDEDLVLEKSDSQRADTDKSVNSELIPWIVVRLATRGQEEITVPYFCVVKFNEFFKLKEKIWRMLKRKSNKNAMLSKDALILLRADSYNRYLMHKFGIKTESACRFLTSVLQNYIHNAVEGANNTIPTTGEGKKYLDVESGDVVEAIDSSNPEYVVVTNAEGQRSAVKKRDLDSRSNLVPIVG